MKKDEVQIGSIYAAKVSDKVVPVRIDSENERGGWDATNMSTGKGVRIKSAQRLRGAWLDGEVATPAPQSAPVAKKSSGKTKDAKPKARATRAKTGAKKDKKPRGLDAAAKVLAEAEEPLGAKEITQRALDAGYWQTKGLTPASTVYAAMLREIQKKGDASRFRKAAPGKFELAK